MLGLGVEILGAGGTKFAPPEPPLARLLDDDVVVLAPHDAIGTFAAIAMPGIQHRSNIGPVCTLEANSDVGNVMARGSKIGTDPLQRFLVGLDALSAKAGPVDHRAIVGEQP